MINLYAGVIDEHGTVDTFYPMNITMMRTAPEYNEYSRASFPVYELESETTHIYHTTAKISNEKLDATPIDYIDVMCKAYNIDRTDVASLMSLKGKKLNFFNVQNPSSKLNMTLHIINTKINDNTDGKVLAKIFLGDMSRAIGFYYCCDIGNAMNCLVSRGQYHVTNIPDLLEQSRYIQTRNFNNKIYTQWMNGIDYSLFLPYTASIGSTSYDLYSLVYSEYNMRTLNKATPNLSNWSNWFTMLTGKYYYGEPFQLELKTPVKGIDKIDLAVPITLTGIGDTARGDESFNGGYAVNSYWNVGTDLNYLFDNKADFLGSQSIFLKEGSITRNIFNKYGEDNIEFIISFFDKGLKFLNRFRLGLEGHVVYNLIDNDFFDTYSSINKYESTYFINGNNFQGSYITVNPDFVSTKSSNWLNLIDKEYNSYTFEESPFTLFSCVNTYSKTNHLPNIPYFDARNNSSSYVYPQVFANNLSYNNTHVQEMDLTYPIDYEFWEVLLTGAIPKFPGINFGSGSIGGGLSAVGGGTGSFSDKAEKIDVPNTPSGAENLGNMFTLYSLNDTKVQELGAWLNEYSKENSYLDKVAGIVGFKRLYSPGGTIDTGVSVNVNITSTQTPVIAPKVSKQFDKFILGNYTFTEYFGRFLDYAPYTKIQLYLPFIGFRELDVDTVMGAYVELCCVIDYLTGNIQYLLSVDKNNVKSVLYTWNGNCACDIPLTSTDYSQKVSSAINTVASIGSMAVRVAGGAAAMASGAGAGLGASIIGSAIADIPSVTSNINNTLLSKPTITQSGATTGSLGMMSVLYPYIMTTRPKISLPENMNKFKGYPCNMTFSLKSLKGFTVVENVHLEGITGATRAEIDEIESILKQGVIF